MNALALLLMQYLPMVDSTEQDLLQYFDEAFAFIGMLCCLNYFLS
jgi:hypothetical protein